MSLLNTNNDSDIENDENDMPIVDEDDGILVEDGDDDHDEIMSNELNDIDNDDDENDENDINDENDVNNEKKETSEPNKSIIDYIGGDVDDSGDVGEIDEDIIGETNKKILNHNNVLMYHPESQAHNYDEIHKASIVTRNSDNIIVDKLHTTIPIMTKYEKAKVLGQRTKQLDVLSKGDQSFVSLGKQVMDNSLIAEQELYEKKLPFIIQRPLPGGGFEYWHVKDLEVIRDD